MSIKEKLKKIPLVMTVWHGISHCKVICNQNRAENYIKKIIKNNRNDSSKKNRKIKVGFIAQVPTVWDKSEDVFLEMLKRGNIETKLLVIPKDSWTDYSKFDSYNDNFFLEKYPEYCIKAIKDDGSILNIKELNFDYIFYPRPYDVHLPQGLRSTDLVKVTKCCYIPYGYSCSDNFNDCNVENPFFDNIYMEFCESEYLKNLLYKKYKKSCDNGTKHFEVLGYPVLAKYIDMKPRNGIKTITWTPRWSYDPVVGGSNFIEYKDNFVELCRKLPKYIKVIFRPHPLMFDELVAKKIITSDEKNLYITTLKELNVSIDLENPIDDVLSETDILLSDFSSILVHFFITNRPIVYCKKNIKFNEDLKDSEQYMYVAKSWTEVETYIKNLIKDKDKLSTKRNEFINKKFGNLKISARKIVDKIVSDYEGN